MIGSLDALANIVKQQREVEQVETLHIAEEPRVTLVDLMRGVRQLFEDPNRHQRVLVHRVAVVKIANDQAVDEFEFGKEAVQHSGLAHRFKRLISVGQKQDLPQARPMRPRVGKVTADRVHAVPDATLGLRRHGHPVSRLEFEYA